MCKYFGEVERGETIFEYMWLTVLSFLEMQGEQIVHNVLIRV